jgi:hypothetical protein
MRLEQIRANDLSEAERAAVAVSLQAARALLRQQTGTRPPPGERAKVYRPPSDPGEGSPVLDYCKALCRTLSPEKRALLLRWLADNMPD